MAYYCHHLYTIRVRCKCVQVFLFYFTHILLNDGVLEITGLN